MQRNKSCVMEAVSDRLQADDLDEDCHALATTLSEPETCRLSYQAPQADQVHISDLPENVVRTIAQFCLQSGGRQSSILSLLAMCGVCKHWRKSASYLSPGSSLLFDGTKATGTASSTLEQKYRTLPQAERTRILHAAASLFRGYSHATFTGDAVDDTLLQLTATNTNLTHLSVTAAPKVTDAGISAAVMASPGLTSLNVGGTSVHETYGHFLGKVLALKNLTKFEVKSLLLDLQEVMSRGHTLYTESWPVCGSLKHLIVSNPILMLNSILEKLPNITVLELEGSTLQYNDTTMPRTLTAVSEACNQLTEVHLQVDQPNVMDASLLALRRITQLQVLSIAVGSFILDERQMSQLGELQISDLTLISQVYKKQPTLPRPCCSHLDNAGVKAYVDAVCQRSMGSEGAHPLKLSICGASQLTHDAVSALLRLPILIRLNIAGCNRIAAMDRMRLIAKIKAGREQQSSHAAGGSTIGMHMSNLHLE